MKTIKITSIFLFFSILSFSQDKLYTPSSRVYATSGGNGIGINENSPGAALHIHEEDNNGIALNIDIFQDQGPLIGGGFGTTEPDYALKVMRYMWGIPSPDNVFSIDNEGKTRIRYTGTNGGESLSVDHSLGVFDNSTNKVNLKYSGTQPEFSWTTSSNRNLRFKNTNNSKTPLSLSPSGKVGINTEDFFDDHDLYVNGSVYIKGDSPETYSIYIEGIGVAEELNILLKK